MQHSDLLLNYDDLKIRKLKNEIKKNGFIYKLIKRSNLKCIYAQTTLSGIPIAYEVFLTKLGHLKKAKKRWAKLKSIEVDLEASEDYYEIFPSDEEFGSRAWTYSTLELAEEAFNLC
jgi:hypothetical protein